MHFAENSEDIIFGLHASCLELARLAFKRYGHQKDLRQFVQCLIYHRRKNLDEKEELRFPEEPTGKNIPPCYIEWDNGSYYGLRRKNGQEPTRPTVSSLFLVLLVVDVFCVVVLKLTYNDDSSGAGGILWNLDL